MSAAVALPFAAEFGTASSTFGLVFLAEMGDKSQFVCMTLAARHRHWPVLAGTMAAFIVLNSLAVAFGASLARFIPETAVAVAAALVFAAFGIMNLLAKGDHDDEEVDERRGHGIAVTSFLMILLAEMGDKTQIAVASMAGTLSPAPVWVGATLALLFTSSIGVVAGRKLLQRVPVHLMHKIGGVSFLLMALFVLGRVLA